LRFELPAQRFAALAINSQDLAGVAAAGASDKAFLHRGGTLLVTQYQFAIRTGFAEKFCQFVAGIILAHDADFRIIKANQVLLEQLGQAAADVVGEVDSSGAGGAAAEYAQTIASPAAIDNAHNFYFVRVEQSTGIDTVGLRVSFALSPCADPDLDGFVTCGSCLLQPGQTCGDCDETRSTVFPGAPQVCQAKTPLTYQGISVYRINATGSFNLSHWMGKNGILYTVSANAGVLSSTQPGGSIY
jgi:hypothetical protein